MRPTMRVHQRRQQPHGPPSGGWFALDPEVGPLLSHPL
uniref:Uncharacterized protein n=1 Tax=Nonomuraea gerenzanensis TaxID=93944 RepID=A0A1M4ELG3_9ACTN|nr:hypothetical protein BN4615_P9192 [Nonomuraea gerenzanensis]